MNLKNKQIYVGMSIVLIIFLIAVFAEYIAPNDPLITNLNNKLMKPNSEFLAGTDQLGRCVFSRVIYGARYSIILAFIIIIITSVIGVLLGILAGFFGGVIDQIIMRSCDIILAFPGMLLSLVIVGYLGPGMENLAMAMIITSWAGYTRTCRAIVLSIKERDYIKASIVCGSSKIKIIIRHIIPNIMPTIITIIISSVGSTLLKLSGLSFIGLGVQPPIPEWGMMISEGRMFLELAPSIVIFPIIAIFITVVGFNLLGDGIKRNLNPEYEE